MKTTLILIASIAIVAAQHADVEEIIRQLKPLLKMGDNLVSLKNNKQCFEKLVCLLETELDDGRNNPIKHISRFLTNAKQDIDPLAFSKIHSLIQQFPYMSKIINAIRLGQSKMDKGACRAEYSQCEGDVSEMISTARLFNDNNAPTSSGHLAQRSTRPCDFINAGCNGVSLGCGICAIFTFGTCGFACGATVGLYCTLNGMTCT